MPMGKYEDFDSCVRANQDKRSPEAYCGEIKARTEKALTPLAKAREILTQVDKLFGKKPTVPKGPVQNPQPQGIPARVYQGKGFTGVAPAEKRPGAPHPGLARGAGRFQKHERLTVPHTHLKDLPLRTLPEVNPPKPVKKHELSADAPQWGWHPRGPQASPKPVKKNGGGVEEATPELADVTMIGRTLQSVSEILSEHAQEHHDLDKKKSKKPSFAQRGHAVQPGRKPHGQVKPRQQRGAAHGQRVVKQRPDEYPSEWGPKHLYEKITDEVATVAKAVGCPAGQHSHDPYPMCHDIRRRHQGVTRVPVAGGMEDAYGVLDRAVVQARAVGAKRLATLLDQAKAHLPDDPVGAYKNLAGIAQGYTQAAQETSDPAKRMRLLTVAEIARRAAGKIKSGLKRQGAPDGS